jgi:hypothetical protein
VSPSASPYDAILYRYTSTGWVKANLDVYENGTWQSKPLYYWDGSSWRSVDILG